MLWRISQLFSGGGDLLKAEAEIAAKRMRRVAITGVVVAIGLLAALIGLLIALAGGTVALAAEIGWAGALAVTGVVVLAIGIVMAMVARKKNIDEDPPAKGFHMPPEVEAAQAKHQMRDAVDPHESNPNEPHEERRPGGGGTPDFDSIKDKVVDFASKNPAAVASGAFLALSIIGPFRAFKMITRGAALAGMAATAVEHFKDSKHGPKSGGSGPRGSYTPDPVADPTHRSPYVASAGSSTGSSGPTPIQTEPRTEPRAEGRDAASRHEPKPGAWSGVRSPGATAPGRDRP